MTTLRLLQDAAGAACLLLYASSITIAAITALAAPDADQRRAALQVLALLVRGRPTSPDDHK